MTPEELIPLIDGWPFVAIHRDMYNIVTAHNVHTGVEKVLHACSHEEEAINLAHGLREHREMLLKLRGTT